MRNAWIVTVMLAGALIVPGCERKNGEGTAERVGKQIDQGVDKAAEAGKQAYEEGKQAAKKAAEVGSDLWIQGKIKTKLAADALMKALKIDVDVKDGAVTLKGDVGSNEAKKTAADIAKDTEGVKNVTNDLKVAPAAPAPNNPPQPQGRNPEIPPIPGE